MTRRGTKRTFFRRRALLKNFATAAAAGAVALVASPNVSRAQTVNWRFQSTWPSRDVFHEFAQDYVKRVNEMAGNRLRLTLHPAGSIVGAFQVIDATSTGVIDGAHGVTGYWYGKNKAASLFGTSIPLGWEANQLLGWFYYGGGQALYQELVESILKLNVVGFLTGPMPTQPLGWFKKQIRTPQDLRGMKFRTIGLSADIFKEMGASVQILPGGDIVPAIDRGLIDGAEFNNPSSDRALGFPDVAKIYMLGSYHQRVECFEVMFNKGKYTALPAEHQAILRYAAEAASSDMSWKQQDRYSKDFEEMRSAQAVKTFKTPDAILQAQLEAWDRVVTPLLDDPFFKKVVESQRAWARRVVGFYRDYDIGNELAWKHFFGRS
jgi:TRAP-type mannitol/chloroaromatic compound transport system substrate-binding protein